MKLIITRHGESLGNLENRLMGHYGCQLSDLGLKQAEKLAKRLQNVKIDVIYSSDLGRAAQTAQAISEFHPQLKINFDQRLRERAFGELTNEVMPDDWDWTNLPDFVENNQSILDRAKDFINEILGKHTEETVLLVCHGGIKRGLLTAINDKTEDDFEIWGEIGNTSVSEINILQSGEINICYIDNSDHLE